MTIILVVVGTVVVLTWLLRIALQPRVRRISPRKRYTVFAVLLGCGVSAQIVGAVVALACNRPGIAPLFIMTAALLCSGCVLEMRKLSRQF